MSDIGGTAVGPTGTVPTDAVAVVQVGCEHKLIAVARILRGTRVLRLEGDFAAGPSRYSVQVGEQQHLDLASGLTPDAMRVRRPAAFMNHSCDPSMHVQGRDVIALRTLSPGDELTFDYNSTEAHLAVPFVCRCGSAHCVGAVRGYTHLTRATRERLRPLMGPQLCDE
jgi:hypothetical protein